MKKNITLIAAVLIALLAASSAPAAMRKPERFITKNGMTVLLLERKALPFITVSVSVRAGSVFDPEGLSGLGNITADLLTEGTKSRSAKEISEEIDFVGGSLGSSGGIDYASASLTVLSKDRDKGFELLSDILINPAFDEKEIERARSQIRAGIISKEDDPSTVAAEAFNKILFGSHPYALPADGSLETLDRIDRKGISGFHGKYYHPNNIIMAVVGDISKKELEKLLSRHFGKWKKKEISYPENPAAKRLDKKRVEFIDKDISQANVQLGHLGIRRENPDFYAAYVMNYILGGGGFVSRLMTEIRDNRGLVYSVYSYFNPLKDPGPFKVGLQTKNGSAGEAIKESLSQIRVIREKGVSEKELQDAKDYLIGSFPLKFTTNSKIASYLTYMEIYNLGLDYLDRFPKIIEALTVDDVNKVARTLLDPENFVLVVVGNKGKIGKIDLK